ncbi:siderophore ABC transporter substrate-binding protein [Paenibacillus sp.]|uniref:siderophore ABC transporter substrate-binding protein n=1 Tax=Paenibacillus sp. TaxID=58172 RepID=UPI002D4A84E1|nr:siderophore ABC transporter substrate-binding protein [Paenibacillus sp.]HZG88403.1 siderophore ABC transporter substrate-binding protein [Paenibacillus sp.]
MKKMTGLAVLLAFMLLLAACGGGNDAGSGAAAPAAVEAQAEEPTAAESEAGTAEEPAAAAEITVTHQLGETVVPVNPAKVIVFDWGTLDTLDKLGVPVAGVPQSGSVPKYLEKYAGSDYANVGSLQEPDFEKIAEIDPDLILISGRQNAHYEELSKLAPTVFVGVDSKNYMESFKSNVTTLGQIFGKEDEVAAELTAVEKRIAELNAAVTASGKNALIVLTNEGNLSAYGTGSRFGIIHDVFGFAPVDPNIEVSTHGMSVTFEYIVEKNPDYLFVVDRNAVVAAEGAAPASALMENELVKNTKAYQDGNIIYLDPSFWYVSGGGLVSVPEMVKEVKEGAKL